MKLSKKLQIPREYWLVGVVVLIAFLLRIAWLNHNLFFGWEQGRDFLKLKEVLSGDLVFIGPKTDVDGVFHGALSYYLPLPFFIVFGGNPLWMTIAYVLINSSAVFFLYQAVKELFNQRVALFSSIFYAVSYSLVIYSRWLSNPNLVPALIILFFWCLVNVRKDQRMLVGMAFFWTVIFHLQIVAAAVLLLPALVFLWQEKVKVQRQWLMASLAVVGFLLLPYVLFNFKNQNILLDGVKKNFLVPGKLWVERFAFWDEMSNEVIDGLFPLNRQVGVIVFFLVLVLVLVRAIKEKKVKLFLLFWLAAPVVFLLMGVRPLRHYYVTLAVFLPIASALAIDWFWQKQKLFGVVLAGMVIVGNFMAIRDRLPESKANFIHHSQRTYFGDMVDLLDVMYQDASGAEIDYHYYTFPYWQPQAWLYLFEWYGQKKYGYLPIEKRADPMYIIMEPNEFKPVHRDNWYGEFKKGLDLVWSRNFGQLTLEKWEYAGKK